jgi:two-component system, OmpR family, phosphate regulon response regulator PhoB
MKTILVVDDDQEIVEVVQLVLEMEGYRVQTSLDGSCFRRLSAELPDLVLLDVLLAGEDGREICRHLKASGHTKTMPVILFSAHTDISATYGECRADSFIKKPFDLDSLLALVKQYVG